MNNVNKEFNMLNEKINVMINNKEENQKSKYNIVEINNELKKIKNEKLKTINKKHMKKVIEYYTSGKRDMLISNICYLNSLIKKSGKKISKLYHSGKKNAQMKEIIKNFITENFNIEEFCELKNKVIEKNDTFVIHEKIKNIEGDTLAVEKYVKNIKKSLNESVHGHQNAKRQIERIIGQWISGKQTGYCFGFEGPPGVGKTSLAKNGLSKCLVDENGETRPFAFIALGGSCNGSTISGHNYTYVGSTWGKIVDILIEKKCMNPIIFIDELDKVSKTEHGKEIIGILTHLIDTTQNDKFEDKYFSGVSLDLSKVLFIFSYNDVDVIDRILLDRIHRVKFDRLSVTDKVNICNKYLLKEIYENMHMENILKFSDEILEHIINKYTKEAGVRKLKEILFEIISEINLELLEKNNIELPLVITKEMIDKKYLKERIKVMHTYIHKEPKVGIINGLWANSIGMGGIIQIECKYFPTNTFLELKLTGMQGDVMKESMNVAKTLSWNLCTEKERNKLLSKNTQKSKFQGIHIHCPEGAVPKDGPSAGTAITIALYSLLTKNKIPNKIAITGEINLSGNVTKIGGLELKILGGIRAGVKKFFIPEENREDYEKILENEIYKKKIEENAEVKLVGNINDVIKEIFF
tara:strand:- start:413 stop:2326 length:1914 start_codon:yes stop_codon:yes gene_type:complete